MDATLVVMWNPDVYLAFADHRGRPFFDLLSRVGADEPRRVVDLGCGPGNLTVTLAQRWPTAVVEAWDSSPEMVDAARERGVDAHVGDVRTWTPQPDTDVVLTNATLQWVPEHAELLVRWAGQLAVGSWIAMQVPGNFDAPSHQAVRNLARRRQWSEPLRNFPFREGQVDSPSGYAELLGDIGCTVDAWETTYIHELSGEHPVLEWITGTALTSVKSRLTEQQWREFRQELIPMLDAAYPVRADGKTLFPFRRIFVVAQVG
jgi:trans-aconitate 2-methyltransferase